MKIAFIHYHLKPGGVTTVIRRQVTALADVAECLIIAGEAPAGDFPAEITVVPGIGYTMPDSTISGSTDFVADTASAVMDAIFQKWPDGCDICHVHNPLLAKNRGFLKILSILQERGLRLFLQIHDFAENGRPEAYFAEEPYPADCHYGVINSRDRDFLRKAGLADKGVHLLPNHIEPLATVASQTIPDDLVLYPVRAIKRKNIGEALLIALFFPKDRVLAVTLPPNSTRDWPAYRRWRDFQTRHGIRVRFEAARKYGFSELVTAATCIISTSVTEGFGFAFLEPWTANRLLAGRRIDHACEDFEKNGLLLDHLYTRISIPVRAFDLSRFHDRWKSCIQRNCGRFHIDFDPSRITGAFKSLTADDCIDFGFLDETSQEQVLGNLISDEDLKEETARRNPFLADIVQAPDPERRIRKNREAVLRHYSRAGHQQRMLAIYETIISTPVSHRIDKQAIARQFLQPEQFYLIHWESSHEF